MYAVGFFRRKTISDGLDSTSSFFDWTNIWASYGRMLSLSDLLLLHSWSSLLTRSMI